MTEQRHRIEEWESTVRRVKSDPSLRARVERSHPIADLEYPTAPAVSFLVDEVLADALCAQGLDENFEPNEYGIRIESMIEDVNRFRL